MIRTGTAGWQIPRDVRDRFPEAASNLQRYAAVFPCVEINSTFYRPHRPATFERWRDAVPKDFRFAVKAPRTITHDNKLVDASPLLEKFLSEIGHLGGNLGVVLVQLPPSLAFDAEVAGAFFEALRQRFQGDVACEPRHPTWFTPEAERLLEAARIARVAADPARAPEAASPGGWRGFAYWRLHGSPRIYWSAYSPEQIGELAARLGGSDWVIFDNTTSGAATADALALTSATAGLRSSTGL